MKKTLVERDGPAQEGCRHAYGSIMRVDDVVTGGTSPFSNPTARVYFRPNYGSLREGHYSATQLLIAQYATHVPRQHASNVGALRNFSAGKGLGGPVPCLQLA